MIYDICIYIYIYIYIYIILLFLFDVLMFYYLMYLSAVRLKHQFSRKVLPDLPRSPWSLPQPSWRTRSCGARKAGGLEWHLFLLIFLELEWYLEVSKLSFSLFFFQKLGGKWLIHSQHSS